MVDTGKGRRRVGKMPPDPIDERQLERWLARQPREWSVVIAARAALRVLPLARAEQSLSTFVLSIFRATAIARFTAKYPNRANRHAARRAAAAVFAADDAAAAAAAAASAAADVAVFAADAAAAAAASAAAYAAVTPAILIDVDALASGAMTPQQLADVALSSGTHDPRLVSDWQSMKLALLEQGGHWSVWIDWYESVLSGNPSRSEDEDAAFTDLAGELRWLSVEAVNTEIARRLRAIRGKEGAAVDSPTPTLSKAETIARLAEIASPQPSINDRGQLDAGPNKPFDIPTVDEDLSTLPLRQRNLIAGILSDLPANAPRYLSYHLRSYDDELRARGTQPILGILKDNADIIAAAVGAANAEDEWLEPGQRKQFERFAENHSKFVEHFPLDLEREEFYARTEIDEDGAIGPMFVEPFKEIERETEKAAKSGVATADFLAIMGQMTEFARVISTLPPSPPANERPPTSSTIRISPEDRINPVTPKKRFILRSLGTLERSYNLAGSTVTFATASYNAVSPNFAELAAALKRGVEFLLGFLR